MKNSGWIAKRADAAAVDADVSVKPAAAGACGLR
jgi:hypothetical protein